MILHFLHSKTSYLLPWIKLDSAEYSIENFSHLRHELTEWLKLLNTIIFFKVNMKMGIPVVLGNFMIYSACDCVRYFTVFLKLSLLMRQYSPGSRFHLQKNESQTLFQWIPQAWCGPNYPNHLRLLQLCIIKNILKDGRKFFDNCVTIIWHRLLL